MATYIQIPFIAIFALILANVPQVANLGLSALPLAILLGIFWGHIANREETPVEQKFSTFCKQKLLRAGIVLFGFSLSFQQIIAVGWQAVVIDLIVVSSILTVGIIVGIKLLKLPRDVAILTAAGSAICGAAAILATESMLKPKQAHTSVAIATVVLFGSIAMFSYPVIYQYIGTVDNIVMTDHAFGIYIGSTSHEVAQAIAAGQSINAHAMQTAIVVKLIRVMMLAPFILLLTVVLTRINVKQKGCNNNKGSLIPWFVIMFIFAAAANSVFTISANITVLINHICQLFLAMAMVVLGMQTKWQTIKNAGIKPILLALVLFFMLRFGGLAITRWLV